MILPRLCVSFVSHLHPAPGVPSTNPARCSVSAGDAGQRASAAESVPRLLGSDPAGCLSEVVPRVTGALPSSPPDFQRAASASFLAVLRRELLPQSTFTQTFLQSILISVDSNDPGEGSCPHGRKCMLTIVLSEGKMKRRSNFIDRNIIGVSTEWSFFLVKCDLCGLMIKTST